MHGQAGGGGGAQADTSDLEVAWLNPPWGSFDNVVDAMFVLYVASTGDGWEEFMWAVVAAAATTPASLPTRPRPRLPRRWAGMDVTGVDKAPVRNDSSPASAYFIAWMIVGCFVAINLFVGASLAAPCFPPPWRQPRASPPGGTPRAPASRRDRRQLHAHQEEDRRLRLDDARAEAVGRLDARLALGFGARAARAFAPAAAPLLPAGA